MRHGASVIQPASMAFRSGLTLHFRTWWGGANDPSGARWSKPAGSSQRQYAYSALAKGASVKDSTEVTHPEGVARQTIFVGNPNLEIAILLKMWKMMVPLQKWTNHVAIRIVSRWSRSERLWVS
jgi:hypothetical protein